MGTTRIEQAIDEQDIEGEDYDPSCSDIRLGWAALEFSSEGSSGHDFDALWSDR